MTEVHLDFPFLDEEDLYEEPKTPLGSGSNVYTDEEWENMLLEMEGIE